MDSINNSRYLQYKDRLNYMTGSTEDTVSRNAIYRNQNKLNTSPSKAGSSTGSTSATDSASYASSSQNAYKSLAPNAPQEVKDAWEAAAKKTGVNSLTDSTETYLSCLFAIQSEQKSVTGSTDVLGKTTDSAKEAIKKALNRLNGLESEVTNTKIKEYRQKEKDFYTELLAQLD